MQHGIGKNDIPDVAEIKAAMIELLQSGRSRSYERIGSDVAKVLDLSRAQRSYKIKGSRNTLFENRLDKARLELVKEGRIAFKGGKVKLMDSASDVAGGTAATNTAVSDERPTKCLSFQNPYGVLIALGLKTVECRSRKINTPVKNLVVCASLTPKMYDGLRVPGLPYGYAIGMVDVVDCVPFGRKHYKPACMTWGGEGQYAWILENPRMIKPFKVRATAAFWKVADIPEVIPTTVEAYREYVLPVANPETLTDASLPGGGTGNFKAEDMPGLLFGDWADLSEFLMLDEI